MDPWGRCRTGGLQGGLGAVGGGGWYKASVSDCLPLAAPIGLSSLLILTLCGPERVLVVSTETPDDWSCLTTPGDGGGGEGGTAPGPGPCTCPVLAISPAQRPRRRVIPIDLPPHTQQDTQPLRMELRPAPAALPRGPGMDRRALLGVGTAAAVSAASGLQPPPARAWCGDQYPDWVFQGISFNQGVVPFKDGELFLRVVGDEVCTDWRAGRCVAGGEGVGGGGCMPAHTTQTLRHPPTNTHTTQGGPVQS